LTLHALSALRQADAILYDALVDPRVLDWAGPGATVEYAGKRGGRPSPKQRDISLRMIELARLGRRVLRLKGGDPFVFGRGGEEVLALVEAGIPFRIVPGITAGIGGLAAAGIPITYRDANQAVTFLTGHDQTGHVPDQIDWASIAKGSPVLVLYMGARHIAQIAEKLTAAGRSPAEPVAVVSRATLPDQMVLETTLGAVAQAVADAAPPPPTIVCIGPVVALRRAFGYSQSDARPDAELAQARAR
jgi:uroporphyrin-III C-methyltransferase